MKQKFTLASLSDLDMGKVSAAVQGELSAVVRDLVDRPGDQAKRSVILQIDLTPEKNDLGVCETALVDFKISSRVPPRQSRAYSMGVHPSGGLIFNPESPDNVRQASLDEAKGPEQ